MQPNTFEKAGMSKDMQINTIDKAKKTLIKGPIKIEDTIPIGATILKKYAHRGTVKTCAEIGADKIFARRGGIKRQKNASILL